MRQSLLERILQYLARKAQDRRWRRLVTGIGCLVVFVTTYALILPAVTATRDHPVLQAEELTAGSGEELSVLVSVNEEHTDRVILLNLDGEGADLSGSYVFDSEGVCVITDLNGGEIELHRSLRAESINYWFYLDAGESAQFRLELTDKGDDDRFAAIVEAVRAISEEETGAANTSGTDGIGAASPSDAERAVSGNAENSTGETAVAGAIAVASPSDAKRDAASTSNASRENTLIPAAVADINTNASRNATSSNASHISGNDIAEANQIEEDRAGLEGRMAERLSVESHDDGFVELLDGAVIDDVTNPGDGSVDDENMIVTAAVKLSIGSGIDYTEAAHDIDLNAEKRGDAVVRLSWTELPVSRAVKPELVTTVDDAVIAVILSNEEHLPEGAYIEAYEIPEGTTEYRSCLSQALRAVEQNGGSGKDARQARFARFFDITIRDENGIEIEPEGPVQVVISYASAAQAYGSVKTSGNSADAEAGTLNILHFTGDAVEFVEPDAVEAGEAEEVLSFTAEGFSVYGILRTTVIEQYVLASDGMEYKVSVTYGSEAGIPGSAALFVEEITEDTTDYRLTYDEYVALAEDALGWDAGTASYARLFNIKIVDPENRETKYQPADGTAVDVRIQLLDRDCEDTAQVVHFQEGANAGQVVDAETNGQTVAFSTDGFSVYAIVGNYTVEFHNISGNAGFEYVIPGGGVTKVADILRAVGIGVDGPEEEGAEPSPLEDSITDVTFSDENLIFVYKSDRETTVASIIDETEIGVSYSADLTEEQIAEIRATSVAGGEWILISLKPFDTVEHLTVTMKNGIVYVVTVTDAQGAPTGNTITQDTIGTYHYVVNLPEDKDGNITGNVIQLRESGNEIIKEGASVSCEADEEDRDSKLFAQPAAGAGYRFVNWSNGTTLYTTRTTIDGNDSEDVIRPSASEIGSSFKTDTFGANFVPENRYLYQFLTGEGGHLSEAENISWATSDQIPARITAVADPGYRFIGWYDESGTRISGDDHLYPRTYSVEKDRIFTALFEQITSVTLTYRPNNNSNGDVNPRSEQVSYTAAEAQGSTANPRRGYRFMAWANRDGYLVSTDQKLTPTGEMIKEDEVFTALFEPDFYSSYLIISVDDPAHGELTTNYRNNVNGRPVSMYVMYQWIRGRGFQYGYLPGTIRQTPKTGYVFDHWELNGIPIVVGSDGTIHPDTLLGENIGRGTNTLVACYIEDSSGEKNTIQYKIRGEGGTISRSQDTWVGGNYSTIKGSVANVTDSNTYQFGGWVDENNVMAADSSILTFVPSGDQIKNGATYYAIFTKKQAIVGYNMNLAAAEVSWDGPRDIVVTSSKGSTMYYSSRTYKQGETFRVVSNIPKRDGYVFIGWFDKDRDAFKVNGKTYPEKGPTVYVSGETPELVFPYANNSRYTLEALWGELLVESKRLPYDGAPHSLVAKANIETGTLGSDTPRYNEVIMAMLENGTFAIKGVKYELLDSDGNVVETIEGDTFTRTEPGEYRVKVTATVVLKEKEMTITKDASLTIYPANVIIQKVWDDSDNIFKKRPNELEAPLLRANAPDGAAQDTGGNDRRTDAAEVSAAEATGREDAVDPVWQKEGNVWVRTYESVKVRPENIDEDDPSSGYYGYFALENQVPEGYVQTEDSRVLSEDRLTTTITFVNELMAELNIVKHRLSARDVRLSGAQFTIRRIKDVLGANAVEYDGEESDPVTTDENGKAKFDHLTRGYYEVRETEVPEGYVITGDRCFYIRVEGGVISLLARESGKDPKDWKAVEVAVNASLDVESSTVWVGNETGAALPNTGGPGTTSISRLGILLTALACALLMLKASQRLKNAA